MNSILWVYVLIGLAYFFSIVNYLTNIPMLFAIVCFILMSIAYYLLYYVHEADEFEQHKVYQQGVIYSQLTSALLFSFSYGFIYRETLFDLLIKYFLLFFGIVIQLQAVYFLIKGMMLLHKTKKKAKPKEEKEPLGVDG